MNSIARCVSYICLSWMLCFVLVIQTSAGKKWTGIILASMISNSSTDMKGPVPMLCLSIPMLLIGTVCALFLRSDNDRNNSDDQRIKQRSYSSLPEHHHHDELQHNTSSNTLVSLKEGIIRKTRQLVNSCYPLQRLRQRLQAGDWNMDRTALLLIVLPLSIYTILGLLRKDLSQMEYEQAVSSVANTFGAVALVALSFLLVPVARHSPLLKLLNWSPAVAVRLHHWTGRAVVWGGLLHGSMYIFKWKYLQQLSLTDQIVPSASCWRTALSMNHEEDATCYKQLRNLTGALAGLGLVVICVMSLSVIRRTCYAAFYASHMVAGPLVFVCVILHWNRSILYLGGGLLYYLATTLAVYYETKTTLQGDKSDDDGKSGSGGGVRILSVEHIPCTTSSCVSLTVEADASALEAFRPGHYVNLLAPEISSISHPFTINIPPQRDVYDDDDDVENPSKLDKQTNRMQIIFRETGPFTKQLGARLMDCSSKELPRLALDGFHGPSNLLQVALDQHDVLVFVAGGIGITPYLTMLHQLHDQLASFRPICQHYEPEKNNECCCIISPYKTKKIVLHWICRDEGLIEYVQRDYFQPLLQRADDDHSHNNSNTWKQFDIQLIVHRTNKRQEQEQQRRKPPSYTNLEEGHQDCAIKTIITSRQGLSGKSPGVPFSPSKFAAGSPRMSTASCMPVVTSFALIGWVGLWIIWTCYANLQAKEQVASRSVIVLVLMILLPAMAAMINSFYTRRSHNDWQDDKTAATSSSSSSTSTYSSFSDSPLSVTKRADYDELGDDDGRETRTRSSSMSSDDDLELGELDVATYIETGDVLRPVAIGEHIAHGSHDTVNNSMNAATSVSSSVVTIEEREGRPSVHDFINILDDSNNAQEPALYACGPSKLLQDIRRTLDERCFMRFQQCPTARESRIAYYEEDFEM